MPAVIRAKPFVVTAGCVWHCCSNRCCCPCTALGPSSRRCNGGGRGRIGGSLSSPAVLVVGVPSSLTAHWGSRTVARSLKTKNEACRIQKKKRHTDRQTDRDRETHRQTETHRETETEKKEACKLTACPLLVKKASTLKLHIVLSCYNQNCWNQPFCVCVYFDLSTQKSKMIFGMAVSSDMWTEKFSCGTTVWLTTESDHTAKTFSLNFSEIACLRKKKRNIQKSSSGGWVWLWQWHTQSQILYLLKNLECRK